MSDQDILRLRQEAAIRPVRTPGPPPKQTQISMQITKTAHGRSIGDPVKYDGSLAVYAYDDIFGVVWKVVNANCILVVLYGYIDNLPAQSPGNSQYLLAPYSADYSNVPPDPYPTISYTDANYYLHYITATTGWVSIFRTHGNVGNIDLLRTVSLGEHSSAASTAVAGDIIDDFGYLFDNVTSISKAPYGILVHSDGTIGGNVVDVVAGNANYTGSAPAAGVPIYASTSGKVTATRPTSGKIVILGTSLSGGSAGKVYMRWCPGAADMISSLPGGILPLANGGGGQDLTTIAANSVMFKSVVLGVPVLTGILNTGALSVLCQTASGAPVFNGLDTNTFKLNTGFLYGQICGKDVDSGVPADEYLLKYVYSTSKWTAWKALTVLGGILTYDTATGKYVEKDASIARSVFCNKNATSQMPDAYAATADGQILISASGGLSWLTAPSSNNQLLYRSSVGVLSWLAAPSADGQMLARSTGGALTWVTDAPQYLSSYVTLASFTTWGGAPTVVEFVLIGGGGAGGNGTQNTIGGIVFYFGGGAGGSGFVTRNKFLLLNGDQISVSAGAGGTSGGSNGGTTTLTVVRSGVTILSLSAGGGKNGQDAGTSSPGMSYNGTGGSYLGQNGTTSLAVGTCPARGGQDPILTTIGSGGNGSFCGAGYSGFSGNAGGAYYC